MEINIPGLQSIFMDEIAPTFGPCVPRVRIILPIYSYCVLTLPAVKLTKSASAHTAADGADESLGFYFLEREEGEERDGEMEMGINMKI